MTHLFQIGQPKSLAEQTLKSSQHAHNQHLMLQSKDNVDARSVHTMDLKMRDLALSH